MLLPSIADPNRSLESLTDFLQGHALAEGALREGESLSCA